MSASEDLRATPRVDPAAVRPFLDEGRALVRLAVPIMLIALVNMGMSVTDATMVSLLYGTKAFAAVAIGSDLYSIVFYLGAGVVGGLAPFYAAAVARRDAVERAKLRRLGWFLVAGVAALAVPVVWTGPEWLALAGLDGNLLTEGQGYTRAMAATLFPMLGVTLYRTILTSAERPRLFLHVTLTMLPLNAALNYLLMVGPEPFPALGPAGAGVSSLLVASATLGALVAIHRRLQRTRSYKSAMPSKADAAAVLRVGLPIGIATVGEVGIFLAATLYAGRLGAADVAAHTLALRAAGVAYAVPAALLQASLVRMARVEGLGDRATGRIVVASGLGLSLITGVMLCAALALAAAPLSTAFFEQGVAGAAAASLAIGLMLLLAGMEVVSNPGAAAAGLLRGQRDARAPMVYSLFGNWLVGAPLGMVLCEVYGLGVTGLWVGLVAGTAVASVLSLARLLLPDASGAGRLSHSCPSPQ
jgi:multidrug resistance protein, MATE family